MKNVAVMGGAFDPVHEDHVKVARLCLQHGFCEEVWFMPSPDRWDKTLNASPEDRFAMLELVTSDESRFILSDLEIQQGDFRGSYVFLMGLKEKFPDTNFKLLVGADSYENIPHWRDPCISMARNTTVNCSCATLDLSFLRVTGIRNPMRKFISRRDMRRSAGLGQKAVLLGNIPARRFAVICCATGTRSLRALTRRYTITL